MANNQTFSARELCQALEREIHFRRKVFPRRVQQQQMSMENAQKQIAMFEVIRARYAAEAEAEEAKGRLL